VGPGTRRQLQALRRHTAPAWWRDGKLGIFVHWTPASVPGFAPRDRGLGELLVSDEPEPLAHSPYAEWYQNSLRFRDSEVSAHHRATYGTRPYAEFARDLEAAIGQWDPSAWARQFRATGAAYVVFVAKHSDGYSLWPTDVPHPHLPRWHSTRDVVGELADAVRAEGMRFGTYYCGGFDWSFDDTPVATMADVPRSVPRGSYPAYAEAQVRELIDRYRPSVLWNDVAWPGGAARLWPLLAHYYRCVPDGVVNDRWMPWSPLFALTRSATVRRAVGAAARRTARADGGLVPPRPPHFDYRTPENVSFPGIEVTPWECVRGMDRSFGYNANSRPEDFVPRGDLLWELTDVVAKGGNLLVNVGPRGSDGSIPVEQVERLEWLGAHLTRSGAALRATSPWVVSGTTTAEGAPLRYTAGDGVVFAHIRTGGTGPVTATLAEVRSTPTTNAERFDGGGVGWTDGPDGLRLDLGACGGSQEPVVVALRGIEAR